MKIYCYILIHLSKLLKLSYSPQNYFKKIKSIYETLFILEQRSFHAIWQYNNWHYPIHFFLPELGNTTSSSHSIYQPDRGKELNQWLHIKECLNIALDQRLSKTSWTPLKMDPLWNSKCRQDSYNIVDNPNYLLPKKTQKLKI